MAEETMTQFVDNPYAYLRSAQLYQREGDYNGADIAYKAAIMAADKLPLREYSRDFQSEAAKYRSNPGYQTQPGISLSDLTESYADALSLPFRARLLFSQFLMNNGNWDEAESMVRNAAEVGIDNGVANAPLCRDLKERADELLREITLRRTNSRSQLKTTHDSLSHALGKPRATGQQVKPTKQNNLPVPAPVIEEMWQSHMQAQKKARENIVAQAPQTSSRPAAAEDAPLSADMRGLVDSMYSCLHSFSKTIEAMPKFRGIKLSFTEPARVQENLVRNLHDGRQTTETVVFYRFRVSTMLWSLSVRATDSLVEIFAVPAAEVMRLSEIEHDNCRRAMYKLRQVTDRTCWTMDGVPVYADDVRVNLRGLLKELINGSLDFVKMDVDARTSVVGGGGILKRITELSQQRTNLAEKIVYQQEQIQKKIARDLHDTVIGDLYAMKRSMEADNTVDSKYIEWIDKSVGTLRGICADLAPRDLEDWGLRTVIRDMVSNVTARSQILGEVEYDESIPDLAQEVQLQIYRIVQECLINIEKHSRAKSFQIKAEMRDHILLISVTDNGVGFNPAAPDSRTAKVGGMGLDGMKERVQLIRCFYPAQIWINSKEGTGTRTIVQINTAGG